MNSTVASRSRTSRTFAAVALAAVAALALSGCKTAKSMVDEGSAQPGQKIVSLTFDDGPHPTHTPAVLDILKRHNVKAVFFVTGENAARYPALINRMNAEGHVVANHTWNHPRLTAISDAAVADQLTRTQNHLRTRHGVTSKCVRPPYGATDGRVERLIHAHAQGSTTMLWTIDSDDWRGHAPHIIRSNVTSRLHNGGVILLHDGGGNRTTTVQALDGIIVDAKARGYSFGTICK